MADIQDPNSSNTVRRYNTSNNHHQRNAMFAAGGAALLGLGIAAGVMFGKQDTPETPMDFTAPGAGVVVAPEAERNNALPPVSERVQERTETRQRRVAERTSASAGAREYESRTLARAVCNVCGVVESSTPVAVQGQSTGVGAVAGGVLGGVVGNQVGKGSGNTAATVLGAIGGGIAGNEIEKSRRTSTVYRIKVRMDDGTTKTFTRQSEVSPGTKVEVHDGAMQIVGNAG